MYAEENRNVSHINPHPSRSPRPKCSGLLGDMRENDAEVAAPAKVFALYKESLIHTLVLDVLANKNW